jgi:predicted N-acyltransferase
LTRDEQLPVLSKPTRSVMQAALRRWPLLICRSPLAKTSGLLIPDNPQMAAPILNLITHTVRDFAANHGVSFMLFDYLEPKAPVPAQFTQLSVPEPGTRLRLNFDTFDSYASWLGKSAKKDYRRHTNHAENLGIRVQTHRSVTDLEKAISLIHNVYHHHKTPPDSHIRSLLENAHRVNMIWLTAKIEDRLVGCGLLVGDGDTYSLALLGMDYKVEYVYFQLVYAAIRAAIEAGAKNLRGGSGAYEFKQRLGFQLETNNNIAVAAVNDVVRQVMQRLIAS